MKTSFIIYLVELFLLLSISGKNFAQSQKFRFEHITAEQGFPDHSAICSMQDSKGFLWFGTFNGVCKYDGHNFTSYQYDPKDSSSIGGNVISRIFEDSHGTIWVIAYGSGIYLFDRTTEKFIRFTPESGTLSPHYSDGFGLNEDKEGNIWNGNNHDGQLLRYNKQTGAVEVYTSQIFTNEDTTTIRYRAIHIIYKDKGGTLWIGSSNGLHRLNLVPQGQGKPSKVNFTSYRHDPNNSKSLAGNFIQHIYEDRAGMIWAGGDGLNQLDPRSGECKRYIPNPNNPQSIYSNDIYGIAEDKEDNLWVGSDNVLNKLNKDRTSFTRYIHDPNDPTSISGNRIWSLLLDNSNVLWLTTLGGGLDKLDLNQKAIALYQNNPSNVNSLSNNKVAAICEDKLGIVWLGTIGGGLNAWNKQNNTFTHYRDNALKPGSIGSDSVSTIFEDRAGNLWIGGGKNYIGILSRFDRKTNTFKKYSFQYLFNNTFGNPVLTLFEDKQKMIWVGTTGGVSRFNPKTETWVHYTYDPNKPDGLSDYWTTAICEDNRGNLWMGHGPGSNALDKLNPKTGKFTHYIHNPKDSTTTISNKVNRILKDSKGVLWFGTRDGGLCRLNEQEETFTAFTKKNGLPSNTIYSIVEDDDGNLWLTTNNGLCRFNPSTYTCTNFDKEDGLQGNQFGIRLESAGACFKGKDGTLYFGGPNGFNVFHPRNLHLNKIIPPVAITRFSLFNKVIPGKNEARQIELNYNQNFFSFEFAALNYSSPAKNQYAYQLEGIDKDWVYSGTRSIATYTHIGPGKYIFRVKGSNNDGIWNEKGTLIRLIILPPWWRTKLAYGFYFLCFLAGILAVDRYQRRRLIQKEREKAREREVEQAREIEKAYQALKQTQAQLIQKEKMASLGELTAGIAHEIQNPLNFVNNFSEVNADLIAEIELEIGKGNIREVAAIINNVKENEEKIRHHGQRADLIVKSMLQHSRPASSEKQLTDINALAEEYLRLSYHGLRAKNANFNASIVTNFDSSLRKVEVVPQELGRVLLNLFNNAFYATYQKKLQLNVHYEPEIRVSTCQQNGQIEIRVRDNGIGIPENIKSKIFQPFFTTKPTGQGTGLGLSLSYDIITKGHNGELKVNSEEGEFTEFIVQLAQN